MRVASNALDHSSRVWTRTTGFGPTEIQFFSGTGDIDWSVDRSKLDTFDDILGVTSTDIRKLWMPRPPLANTVIAGHRSFSPLFKNQNHPVIMGNCDADGCMIPPGDAFGILSADCATIVAYAGNIVVAAHAGRDSILDRSTIETGELSRGYFSVLGSIVKQFVEIGYRTQDIHLGIFGGIQSNFNHPPDHKEHGAYNRALIDFAKQFEDVLINEETGDINMYKLISEMAVKNYSIDPTNIIDDGVDSGSDRDTHGNLLWASHRHAKDGRKERNFTLVRHVY